jgi:hypothetical protein
MKRDPQPQERKIPVYVGLLIHPLSLLVSFLLSLKLNFPIELLHQPIDDFLIQPTVL